MPRTARPPRDGPISTLLLLWLLPLVTPSPLAAPALGLSSNLQRIKQSIDGPHSNSSSDRTQQVTPQGAVQQSAQNAARASRCPPIQSYTSAPGCPCTLYTRDKQPTGAGQGTTPADASVRPLIAAPTSGKRNVCPAGYRCSSSAADDMISAGWEASAVVVASGLGNISKLIVSPGVFGLEAPTTGLCVACQLGEYCPPGTQEENAMSLAACEINPLSEHAAAASSSSSDQAPGDTPASSCKGFKACPAGSYCPDAASITPCEAGRFCPEGSITSESCNVSGILVWDPFRTVQQDPQTLLEALVNSGAPLTGNTCPANTTTPLSGCPPGYFCPTAAMQLECPLAHYCPSHSTSPIPCPPLANCRVKMMANPDWSWLGLLFMFLLLLGLLTLLEYVRVAGRQSITHNVHQEEVIQLIGAVGFKVVCAGDHCKIQRVACIQPAKQAAFGRQMSIKAVEVGQGTLETAQKWGSRVTHNLKQRLTQVIRSTTAKTQAKLPKAPHTPSKAVTAAGDVTAYDHAAGAGDDGESAKGVKDHTIVTIPQEHWQHVKEPAPAAAAVQEEYQINPRLTLCFRDVWVSDKPLDRNIGEKAIAAVSKFCGRGEANHTSSSSGSSRTPLDMKLLAESRLACAAARGAKFIVPGVSGQFPHSQLHAIMGPSGCGKTTVCKALAGRLPMSRVCGDIRVLCSAAADGFQSKTELALAGSFSAGAMRCNISHMTGFVPQFDLLHEVLTVRENLFQAAFLRLPVVDNKYSFKQRLREVKTVTGEVTTLMALNKVVHQVVGSSAQRTISGGQRKRVAIAVELVAKPSLLWLDEPTSGLDASVAYDVVAALKNSSQRGMNILAVMHQPRCTIFDMFDSCFLLSSTGHVVYAGPQKLALHYMAFVGFYKPPEENTADFLMDVIAGVVPRPGDPDYIPSQLATLWERCGDIWLEQQQQQQLRRGDGYGSLLPADSLPPPPPPPAADAAVDWPWRPRDLESLLLRFRLLVTDSSEGSFSSEEVQGAGAVEGHPAFKASKSGAGGGSMLSYEGFLSFWDEAGVKDVMGEEEFAEFLLGISEDFGIGPGQSISQQQFLAVLKSQLRAAAGVEPAEHAEEELMHDVDDNDDVVVGADAEAPAPLSNSSSMKSPFQTNSMEGPPAAAVSGEGGPAALGPDTLSAIREYKAAATELAGLVGDHHGAAPAAGEAPAATAAAGPCGDAAVPKEMCAAVQAAKAVVEFSKAVVARGATAPTVECFQAAAAAAAAAPGLDSASEVTGSVAMDELSRASSSVLSGRKRCSPGMLTSPAARMQQRVLMRQQTIAQAGSPPPLSGGQGLYASSSGAVNPQQLKALEAVARFKAARRALLKQQAKHQTEGQRQLATARQMRVCNDETESEETATHCKCIMEARGKSLSTLAHFMLQQHAHRQQQQQQDVEQSGLSDSDQFDGSHHHVHGRSAAVKGLGLIQEADDDTAPDAHEDKASARGGSLSTAASPTATGRAVKADSLATSSVSASAAAAGQAAAAAVMSRQLPRPLNQLRIILIRSSRKVTSCRHALMTDLLLTSLLGLALGVAQGRTTDPGSSLLWMLITLLAYGCMMLMRSTNSYGLERHIHLQLEDQAGVSASAWVFGHQIFDITGMLLHPALFYAWMYVLTLSPVPGWSYYIVLLVVGWYTTGLGYLVSLLAPPGSVMLSGLAAALILGGVANGIAPRLWQLEPSHPILWLDALSYTRWGLQALYISWLTPSAPDRAPATASFLSGLGFCGLEPSLMQALQSSGQDRNSGTGSSLNITSSVSSAKLWDMTTAQRADALAMATADNLHNTPAGAQHSTAAAAAAMTQLWQYYNSPHLLTKECIKEEYKAYFILVGLGIICRLLVWLVVKWKTHNKATE